jgi:hypothetical protein
VLKTEGEVIENAYARAPEVAARLIGHEPDGFRLKDAAGKDLSVHPLGAIRGRYTPRQRTFVDLGGQVYPSPPRVALSVIRQHPQWRCHISPVKAPTPAFVSSLTHWIRSIRFVLRSK